LDFSAGIPAAPSLSRGEKARAHRPHPGAAQRGSALLIVLGFLSFLMISAVSFAIYMRIERQASSNYRHSVTARHLLNAGLYRAIDEIDAELRIPTVGGVARPLKFPDWPGRVKPSAVANGAENGKDARVLSLEALSFIPAIFVNDVRRYAIPNGSDVVSGVSESYMGAKWRPLSMPVEFNSGRNASGGAEVGRYAYVCVNLSDMLDVNACSASPGGTNRISIGHLFASEAKAKAFDANKKNTDRRYETLQDFYACMYARSDPTFGSPYHELLNTGDDAGFDEAVNHVLTTDSIVKPEFAKVAKPCNIVETQPVANVNDASPTLQGTFKTALENALANNGGLKGSADLMATMIADYLDKDSIPKRLNVPTVEMVPMISQILVPNTLFAPTIIPERAPDYTDADPKWIYILKLINGPLPASANIGVEVVWPFKNQKDRTPQDKFSVEVLAYLKVVNGDMPVKSRFNLTGNPPCLLLKGQKNISPDFWDDSTDEIANKYKSVPVSLDATDANIKIPIIHTDGTIQTPGFVPGKQFRVVLAVYARVKKGSDYVDSVPQLLNTPLPNPNDITVVEKQTAPKLYFQTCLLPIVAGNPSMQTGVNYPYDWNSLEVPDPRFNHKAANWVVNTTDTGGTLNPKINDSTIKLLGKDGRDGDIFMAVSDIGVMQSPGELGFIVRPFDTQDPDVNFSAHTLEDTPDYKNMFRTIRLYDHGADYPRDKIYEQFIVRNPDGTLPGGTRVNPLSDLPQVLIAAVQNTPVDYYWAGEKTLKGSVTATRNNVFNETLKGTSWRSFTNGWFQCLQNAKTASSFNTSLNSNLSDVYGRQDLFGWYTGDEDDNWKPNPLKVFKQTLSEPLHEIDRKMLFDYTLNNFSDRQQLFLYILRAEATVPSFGGSDQGGVRSVAGGRAVALVWRDPYPRKKADGSDVTGNFYTDNSRVSPWYQHNIKRYDDQKDEADLGPDGNDISRSTGYHDHRILFFKQLDN